MKAWEEACEQMMRMPKPAMEAVHRSMMRDPMAADICQAMMRKHPDMADHGKATMPGIGLKNNDPAGASSGDHTHW